MDTVKKPTHNSPLHLGNQIGAPVNVFYLFFYGVFFLGGGYFAHPFFFFSVVISNISFWA